MVLSLLIVPILFCVPVFLASELFSCPVPHGIYSFDALLLLIAAELPYAGSFKQRNISRISFFIGGFLLFALSNSMDNLFYGLSIIIVYAAFSIPYARVRKILFFVISIAIILCDWSFFFSETFSQSLFDVWRLANYYIWGPAAFVLLPVLQAWVIWIVVRRFFYIPPRNSVIASSLQKSFFLFALALFVFCVDFSIHGAIPSISIADYPIRNVYWEKFTPEFARGANLFKETRKNFKNVYDREPIIDTDQKTVMILLESFGVNHNNEYFQAMIESISIPKKSVDGVIHRFTSNTQGAEWNDFHYTPDGGKTLVQEFKDNGLSTFYVHGFKGNFYERDSIYPKIGFDSLFFYDQLKDSLFQCNYGFEGICDSSMTKFIAALLDDPKPKFIYWTTLDSHPPYEGQSIGVKPQKCEDLELSDLECLYYVRITNTLGEIRKLAIEYPDYKFIIRGDHRPMGSLQQPSFIASFYFEWVPIIILN